MRLTKFIVSALFSFSFADSVPWNRLEIDKALLLILDMQVGLYTLARDFDSTLYYQNMLAHAALGQIFDIPVVLTTSSQQGPNGPSPKEILEMYPDAPLIQRQGEVSAWDNAEFRAAVQATNRTQVIVGGIVTDVCMTSALLFCSLLSYADMSRHNLPHPRPARRRLQRLGQCGSIRYHYAIDTRH